MKFLCLGYFDSGAMDAMPPEAVEALMGECKPHLDELERSGRLVVDAGLSLETTSLRRLDGEVHATTGALVESRARIGSAFIVDAHDLDDAVRIARLHPTLCLPEGERLGWAIEIRPLHYFRHRAVEN